VTEKSEGIATCKEMPVIMINKVVDKRRIIGKRVLWRRRGTRGSLIKKRALREVERVVLNRYNSNKNVIYFKRICLLPWATHAASKINAKFAVNV
jgi:ribosomal protein S25